ncbi:hypothetical protein F5884DRAFT_770178 [Xylogone sp. PMI_703]|nr:hypothetical protein F5884DRAFT_770178 [Xylogone sp. PMI_703]
MFISTFSITQYSKSICYYYWSMCLILLISVSCPTAFSQSIRNKSTHSSPAMQGVPVVSVDHPSHFNTTTLRLNTNAPSPFHLQKTRALSKTGKESDQIPHDTNAMSYTNIRSYIGDSSLGRNGTFQMQCFRESKTDFALGSASKHAGFDALRDLVLATGQQDGTTLDEYFTLVNSAVGDIHRNTCCQGINHHTTNMAPDTPCYCYSTSRSFYSDATHGQCQEDLAGIGTQFN